MGLERVEIMLCRLPYVHYFETSFGREYDRTFVIVKVCENGIAGYGEVVAPERPLYSYETTQTAWHVLRDFFVPVTLQRSLVEPDDFYREMQRFRGHPMAKAGLELALWDLKAKKEGEPLSRIYGGIRKTVPSGVSVGIQDAVSELIDRIQDFLNQGYKRIKIKIKKGWDIEVCREVRKAFPGIPLHVDANGGYTPDDIEHLRELDGFSLLMVEQPFPPYDLWDHARLQSVMETPVCLDESIVSLTTARQAFEMKSGRIINIKVGRVSGAVEAKKIHDFCMSHGIPVWCGGMLESGIGRAHNLHLATLKNFILPNDLSASRRYYGQDLVEPPFELNPDGTMTVPEKPGIGVDVREDRIKKSLLKQEIVFP